MTLQPQLDGLTTYRLSGRSLILESLAEFRLEWQKAAQGKSLVEVEAPVGLILSDIADKLGLNSHERYAVLGGKLINQVDSLLEERVSLNLPE